MIIPPFTFTADASTDKLAITAHGLLTGEPFLQVRTRVGLGVLPAPLAPATYYWAIRVDADHLKLAASSTDAMAGTAINLTTSGSGTLELLVGLPYSIPSIVVPGSITDPDTLNATWESVQAVNAVLTGQPQTVYPGICLDTYYHGDRIKMFNGASAIPATNVTQSTTGASTGTAAAVFTIPLDGFDVGDRLKSVTFKARGSAAGTLTASLSTGSGTTSNSSPAQTGVSVANPPASDTDYTVTITSPDAMTAALGAWFLTASISTAGTLGITNIRATYDRPRP